MEPSPSPPRWTLPPQLEARVAAALHDWDERDGTARLWARDATLWTGGDEGRWLGWLDVVGRQRARMAELTAFGRELREEGIADAVVLGMGGSSLAPEVLATVFAPAPGQPRLHVLDSTDPEQVAAVRSRLDLERSLFVVASKSGTTLEPSLFHAFFLAQARAALGDEAAKRFVAITDPGSRLEATAREQGFRRVFHGEPAIGGRYSALSDFGLVPAAILGLDLDRLLGGAERMAEACRPGPPAAENPGVGLGVLLGELARAGRDKVTLVASPLLWDLGAWLEQLLAESTGKQGRGLVPVDGEDLGEPAVYGEDRVFVQLRLAEDADPAQDAALEALERAGQPVVRLEVAGRHDLGAEFFRWEVATAAAGAVLGIHPFDQPDVEAAKVAARRLTEAYEASGELPVESPFCEQDGMELHADPANVTALRREAGRRLSLAGLLRVHLARLAPGDYFALLAYVAMSEAHRAPLQSLRHAVRDRRRVATCLGFGPRYLHSTGQVYKGGPNSGVFLQVTARPAADLALPEGRLTFGVVEAAQARGDFEVLAERGRRALRVHLTGDAGGGLAELAAMIRSAMRQPVGS